MGFSPKLNDNSTPFNMAFATLIRLDEILKEINQIYTVMAMDPINAQSIKADKIRSFFVQSSVLLPAEKIKEIRERYMNLKGKIIRIERANGFATSSPEFRKVYDANYDIELDNALLDLLLALQENKVFMPSKSDVTSGWKQ